MAYENGVVVDSLVIIESLEADELKTGKLLAEDLAPDLNRAGVALHFSRAPDIGSFRARIAELVSAAKGGARPILHLEMHGADFTGGLVFYPSKEILPWEQLAELLRDLNRATRNNLVVVMAVCFGFDAVMKVKVTDLTPFCMLFGHPKKVSNLAIRNAFGGFYRKLFEASDFEAALESLPNGYRSYNCEELFARVFAKYLAEQTVGAGGRARVDSLLQHFSGLTGDQQADIRRKLEELLAPMSAKTKEAFARFRSGFLMIEHSEDSDRFTLTLEDLIARIVPSAGESGLLPRSSGE